MKLTQFANHYYRQLLPLLFWTLSAGICDAGQTTTTKTHEQTKRERKRALYLEQPEL